MNIEFEGIDELIREVEKIEGVTEDLKDEALIKGGDFLKEQISSEVYSHGLTRRSGEAQGSITRTDPANHELFVGTKGGAQAPGFYLYMHEFGFWNVRAQRFIAPKPLVSIVYENNKDNILNQYVDVFQKGLGMS
ncbi:HK97-gp10 family putative phage morphogenesis protein [Gracilibacillus alcaliphilus]|uniref:hypothetical protein n=1 Tax=Gracilibacillus alcaliphilus TaxID=1401441 RepID=UPI00195AB483|nr:hypothetical protein [Gracilibacillus alcaliphilus]MBM7678380.1 HK97 gp10 family phage protein [Gracilibacillus alcaliphilus]